MSQGQLSTVPVNIVPSTSGSQKSPAAHPSQALGEYPPASTGPQYQAVAPPHMDSSISPVPTQQSPASARSGSASASRGPLSERSTPASVFPSDVELLQEATKNKPKKKFFMGRILA